MNIVDRVGQVTAERIGRRRFLERSAQALFGGTLALAGAVLLPTEVFAAETCPYVNSGKYDCEPSRGIYCSNCSGGHCGGNCVVDGFTYPNTGCWCTLHQTFNGQGGEFSCCDCKGGTCGLGCTCKIFWPVNPCPGCQHPTGGPPSTSSH